MIVKNPSCRWIEVAVINSSTFNLQLWKRSNFLPFCHFHRYVSINFQVTELFARKDDHHFRSFFVEKLFFLLLLSKMVWHKKVCSSTGFLNIPTDLCCKPNSKSFRCYLTTIMFKYITLPESYCFENKLLSIVTFYFWQQSRKYFATYFFSKKSVIFYCQRNIVGKPARHQENLLSLTNSQFPARKKKNHSLKRKP